MDTLHLVDPGLRLLLEAFPPLNPSILSLEEVRERVFPMPEPDVSKTTQDRMMPAPGPAGAPDVEVLVYRPKAVTGSLLCIYHISRRRLCDLGKAGRTVSRSTARIAGGARLRDRPGRIRRLASRRHFRARSRIATPVSPGPSPRRPNLGLDTTPDRRDGRGAPAEGSRPPWRSWPGTAAKPPWPSSTGSIRCSTIGPASILIPIRTPANSPAHAHNNRFGWSSLLGQRARAGRVSPYARRRGAEDLSAPARDLYQHRRPRPLPRRGPEYARRLMWAWAHRRSCTCTQAPSTPSDMAPDAAVARQGPAGTAQRGAGPVHARLGSGSLTAAAQIHGTLSSDRSGSRSGRGGDWGSGPISVTLQAARWWVFRADTAASSYLVKLVEWQADAGFEEEPVDDRVYSARFSNLEPAHGLLKAAGLPTPCLYGCGARADQPVSYAVFDYLEGDADDFSKPGSRPLVRPFANCTPSAGRIRVGWYASAAS